MYNVSWTVPTHSKVFLRDVLNKREKQILTSVIEIQKENSEKILVKSFKIQRNDGMAFFSKLKLNYL